MKHLSQRSTLGALALLGSGLLASGLLATPLAPPPTADSHTILLRSVHLKAHGTQTLLQLDMMTAPSVPDLANNDPGRFLAHFHGEPATIRKALEAQNITVYTYLPHDTWLIGLTGSQARLLEGRGKIPGLQPLLPYQPAYKISPEVAGIGPGSDPQGILIHLFPDANVEKTVADLEALGLVVEGVGGWHFPRLGLRLTGDALQQLRNELAQRPEVFWLEHRGQVRLLNDEAVPIVQSGENLEADGYLLTNNGLTGEGQIVGFLDTGLDFDSCYFSDSDGIPPAINLGLNTEVDLTRRKVIAYDFLYEGDDPNDMGDYDSLGHGTHVAGNIGGDNLLSPLEVDAADGMALGVKFVVQDGGYAVDDCADLPALGCPVIDLQPIFDQAYRQGARIHNNSWGDNENGVPHNNYSAGSEDVDAFMYSHPDFLLVFAAGNDGPGEATVGSPATSKNGLAVGGTGNGDALENIALFSSRGPTADGRLKPDVLAPASNTSAGTDRLIGEQSCALDTGSGTSYASPLVAGAAALVRQYFEQGYHVNGMPSPSEGFSPTATLVKAVLINSGRSMRGAAPFPNMEQGWGRVALTDALPLPGSIDGLKIEDGGITFASSTDSPHHLQFQVTSNTSPLKITLVWLDPPSNPAAELNLINDLDLTLTSARRTWRGNVFRNGHSVTDGAADTLNNVEQVLLLKPRVGTYTVTISPSKIVEGPQDFALVIRGQIR